MQGVLTVYMTVLAHLVS